MSTFKGSCLCGQISYEITGAPLAFYHCHCQRCRKAYGSGHASNIRIDSQEINWLSGEELISSYRVPDAIRFKNDFCSNCGSPVPRYFPQTQFVLLPAGTLDHEPDIQPQARIFNDSKAAWSCTDDLPGFEEAPT